MSYLSGLIHEMKIDFSQFLVLFFGVFGILFGMMIMTFIFAQNSAENIGLNETMSVEHIEYSNQVQNDSLRAINSYTGMTSTQLLTIALSLAVFVCLILYKQFEAVFGNKNFQTSRSSIADVGA